MSTFLADHDFLLMQTDSPPAINRGFIEDALKKTIKTLQADVELVKPDSPRSAICATVLGNRYMPPGGGYNRGDRDA